MSGLSKQDDLLRYPLHPLRGTRRGARGRPMVSDSWRGQAGLVASDRHHSLDERFVTHKPCCPEGDW